MAGDVLFANAKIIMYGDTHLLTRKRIREMAAATDHDALLRILAECGYDTESNDDWEILRRERINTLATFCELCDDEALVTCVTALDQLTEHNAMAQFTTIATNLPRVKTPSIRDYFVTLADLTNARTYYKGGNQWVPGGKITPGKALKIFPNLDANQIQTEIDQRLDALAAIDQDDIFKPNPLFWWYLQKQKEMMVVKTILMCKRFNYDANIIRENLRGLYEQFK